MSSALGPQFLYHGTAVPIKGDRIVSADEHGGLSYWDETEGGNKGIPARSRAWAHPDEDKAWDFALDRTNYHYSLGAEVGPRARVYAVHPNDQQQQGRDIKGEVMAPHFDIAHPVDTKPGHQGTFPEINWNEHALGGGSRLPGDEDANHPTDLSIQFGHRAGVHGNYGQPERAVEHLQHAAQVEDTERSVDRRAAVHKGYLNPRLSEDVPLPLPPKGARR